MNSNKPVLFNPIKNRQCRTCENVLHECKCSHRLEAKPLLEKMFVDVLLGAINTYIRMINETNKEFGNTEQIIENQYEYAVLPPSNDFYLYLIVDGEKREIVFPKEDWYGLGKNVLDNNKLKQLHDDLTVA